ncbi:glycoside hydrolase family 3 protein [Acidipila sp. EB88]|uniref:beta-glucosidase n=1 Tax=Acidipila sp. EB88 TaxID=2305226 RepID=UPI000F601213|nr:glycoside hydrolase family 3 C-terminal domain-containing protein [Acidipila sp. EB88]RRA48127.1 glycosyl hydrolase [Acidipila sp. EB88]
MASRIKIFGTRTSGYVLLALTIAGFSASGAKAQTTVAQQRKAAAQQKAILASKPWMDKSLSPDERADLLLKEMTLDEKLSLLHGNGMAHGGNWQMPLTAQSNGGAGYIAPIARLGLPGVDMSDAAYGVRSSGENGRYSTAMPSNAGAAASWDRHAAYEYGALIGRELRAQGYNMTLGGGVNLTREPRNGRTFEYLGEDPVLGGTLVGQLMTGEQAQHVIGDIKHYAINDQETGRTLVNAVISKRAMREGDLLAFQIGVRDAQPGAVMCSYNRINGDYACENDYLLNQVLKGDWKFPGFVLSDWGGTHSTVKASHAGLDNEEPIDEYFGPAMKKAVQAGQVSVAEIDGHVHRMLRSYFADGIVDYPVERGVIDVEHDLDVTQQVEEGSIVLLKNEKNILPLENAKVRSIAVIGAHADVGMLSGGGSAQVDPPGGNAIAPPGQGTTHWQDHVWFPTSPLRQLEKAMPGAKIAFNAGDDPAAAAAAAKQADVAIVFVQQWESEGMDLPTLGLPDNQDALVEAVAAANPHTVVVLETGSPALMPWAGKVEGIVEAWYSGSRGATALANILTGAVNPSGKLPNTFPMNDADLPHATIPPLPAEDQGQGTSAVAGAAHVSTYTTHYDEGLKIGYKWYDAEHKPVLFPFGYGLSYTTFGYSGLKVTAGEKPTATLTVKNTGKRAGAEVVELYAMLPASAQEPPKRLVGFDKVMLQPGESRTVTIDVDPLFLSVYDEASSTMKVVPGAYTFAAGGSSQTLPLKQEVTLSGTR